MNNYNSDLIQIFKNLEFSPFAKIINSEEKWSDDELIELACSESWNKDEITEDGSLALKHLFFRIIVPKEHWNDCDYEKFVKLVKYKLLKQSSDD